jgi:hypothetical protein
MGFSLQVSFDAMPDTGSVTYCGKRILERRTWGRHHDLFPFSKGYAAVHRSVNGTITIQRRVAFFSQLYRAF